MRSPTPPVVVALLALASPAAVSAQTNGDQDTESSTEEAMHTNAVPACSQAAGCLISQHPVVESCPVEEEDGSCPDTRATNREHEVFYNLADDAVNLWVTFSSDRRCACESVFYLMGRGPRTEVTRIDHGAVTAFAVTVPPSGELRVIGAGQLTVQGR